MPLTITTRVSAYSHGTLAAVSTWPPYFCAKINTRMRKSGFTWPRSWTGIRRWRSWALPFPRSSSASTRAAYSKLISALDFIEPKRERRRAARQLLSMFKLTVHRNEVQACTGRARTSAHAHAVRVSQGPIGRMHSLSNTWRTQTKVTKGATEAATSHHVENTMPPRASSKPSHSAKMQ